MQSDFSDLLLIKFYAPFLLPFINVARLYRSQREVADILLREQLEEWRMNYRDIFSVLYCVGETFEATL